MSRFVAVSGNEDPALVALYLCEGLRTMAAKSLLSPVLVDAGGARGSGANHFRFVDPRDPSMPRGVKRIEGSDVPVARGESLPSLREAWGKKGGVPAEGKTFFVLPVVGALAEAAAITGRVLFFAKPSAGTASILHGLVNEAARLSPRPISIAVAVSGSERIEDAAAYYRELSTELANLSRREEPTEFSFAGALFLDRERLAAAYAVGSPYGELFPDDALSGALAFIGRRILEMFSSDASEDNHDLTKAIANFSSRRGTEN